MLKCKRLKRLGFRVSKTSKEKKVMMPRSFFGECLFNLQRLKAHYHHMKTSYLRKMVLRIKAQKKPNLHNELVSRLESRLDSVLFRSGMVRTIGEAAQMVSHGKVKVDGRTVNIRSFQVPLSSTLEVRTQRSVEVQIPPYLEQVSEGSFRLISFPTLDEIVYSVPIDFTKVISALIR